MIFLYNIALVIYALAARVMSIFSHKARGWVDGRDGLLNLMERRVSHDREIVWVHVASLGEFEQGRPVIERIRREYPDYQILITFFSPSGYETRCGYEGADYIFYLPLDTPSNVRRFLDIVKPQVAIFVKYEYWLNYLSELRARGVKTYIISAIFRQESIFFKPWGGMWRTALKSFDSIFVQDENSKQLLSQIGFDNAVVAGDTRFDRVRDIAKGGKELPEIERFAQGQRLFVAGSTWPQDEELLELLIQKYRDVKFVIAPHEIDSERIASLKSRLDECAVRYSEYRSQECQVMILDTMGMLSSVYKYGTWGYIGGGFGKGIHNTLEAATFGLPIAFGTEYHKFKEARDLVSIGVARSVAQGEELEAWFSELYENDTLRSELSKKAFDFMEQQCGATTIIMESIFQK